MVAAPKKPVHCTDLCFNVTVVDAATEPAVTFHSDTVQLITHWPDQQQCCCVQIWHD